MKPIIMDMKDMSDSTEVYESRPNPFLIYFIYLLAAMFVMAFLWMSFSKIDIVVTSNGMFKSYASVSEISSNVTGKVSTCNVRDGQYVNEGDMLYTLEVTSLDDTMQYYQSQLNSVDERIVILQAYIEYLDGYSKAMDSFNNNTYYEEIIDRKDLLDANIEAYASDDTDIKDIYVLTEKKAVAGEMLMYLSKKDEYENYLKSYNIQNDNRAIKANASGYFYLQQEMKNGTYIQEGTAIGKIYSDDETDFYAQIYVGNYDIGKIKEGQTVQFEIPAYPSSEYGYFSGEITNISKDISIDQSIGTAYYIVQVSCDNSTICNKDGESISILNGMACQAKIIVDEENVLKYLLRKIELLD